MRVKNEIWIATGLRTPFAKAEKELKNVSALDMSKEVLNSHSLTSRHFQFFVKNIPIKEQADKV